jgi:uncharacterized membrane protein (UPF0136 family)
MKRAGFVILLYGFLVFAGGVVGYTTAGSIVSVVAGSVVGIGLIASAVALLRNQWVGLYIALGLTGVLTVLFGYRFLQTRVWMPSGAMALVSLAALIFVFPALRQKVA